LRAALARIKSIASGFKFFNHSTGPAAGVPKIRTRDCKGFGDQW
jgi:hypothetical protein